MWQKKIDDSTSMPCWGCRQDQRLGPQSLASGQIVDACGFGWVCGCFLATLMRLRTCFVGLSPCGSGERSTGRKVKRLMQQRLYASDHLSIAISACARAAATC